MLRIAKRAADELADQALVARIRLIYGAHDLQVDVMGLTVAELHSAYQDVLSLCHSSEAYLDGKLVEDWNAIPESGGRLEFMKLRGTKGSAVVCELVEFVALFDVNDEELSQLVQTGIALVSIGNFRVLAIKEARLALERIRRHSAPATRTVHVDLERGRVAYNGELYPMDEPYLSIVKALDDANGEVRSSSAIRASSPILATESRIDRLITKLRKQHPTIGKLIKPVQSKGYRLSV